MVKVKFPDTPNGFDRLVVYKDNGDYILVARNGDFVTVFVWDGYSVSWNTDKTYIRNDQAL